MHDDDFTPREHDHLVEPMYAGLGCGGEERRVEADGPAASAAAPSGLWAALARLLRSLKRARS